MPPKKRPGKMTVEQIDALIRKVSSSTMSNAEKIEFYSALFLGSPYKLVCQGDGPYARYDREPLMNFRQINCMTYCEQVLALALSSYYEEFFNVLQHIRYRDGIIGMATRNHYTMGDWLPQNKWCLQDVTRKVGGKYTKQVTRTISHKTFFEKKGLKDIRDVLPDRTMTIDYIPLDDLPQVEANLRSGDIVSLIQNVPGIFSAHMLMVYKDKKGKTYFRHASLNAGTTLDQPFEEYISNVKKDPRYQGMSFMRVRENVRWKGPQNITHGKVFLRK
jgi:hypothetical protein